jgi:prepilin-type N-terminal cleavage/methylation domain-containing protein/prepilin-type processing-associated H-X9-DG protein
MQGGAPASYQLLCRRVGNNTGIWRVFMRSRGFTLIELLVVIAIIAILAAILFPVFAKAREKARQSSCQSNLKQIGISVAMYMQDYDERTPKYWRPLRGGSWWNVNLEPYIKNSQVWRCPSEGAVPANLTPDYSLNAHSTQNGDASPAYNSTPGTTGSASSTMSEVSTLLCTDGDRGEDIMGCLYSTRPPFTGAATLYSMKPRHNDGLNCAFFDGHVKWMRPDVLYVDANGVPLPASLGNAADRTRCAKNVWWTGSGE